MLKKLILVFKIPELRRKIFLTLALLFVYRLGFFIPLPMINQEQLHKTLSESGGPWGQALQVVELFSASNFGMSTIFGMGIMPYISASIILQLLGTVYPPLEKLQKEGEAGRRKINEYTRYATVVLSFVQSFGWITQLRGGFGQSLLIDGYQGWHWVAVAAITMTCGTVLLMWIGEQIDEYGVGNGISLLIMAGILARSPRAFFELLKPYANGLELGGNNGAERLLVLGALFIAVMLCVIAVTQATRKIPTQSAKHVRGRRVWGGQKQYLPLKVNQSGVMPIIFASSLLMFPQIIFQMLGTSLNSQWLLDIAAMFLRGSGFIYNISYIALIYFFCYFWTAISFNPKDMANNLRDYGSFIPGHRPGKRTAEYLEKVMVRITYVGAAFLAVVAVIPTLISDQMHVDYVVANFFGGTGLLILVSVALDLVQKIDSHLVMRNYTGLLEA